MVRPLPSVVGATLSLPPPDKALCWSWCGGYKHIQVCGCFRGLIQANVVSPLLQLPGVFAVTEILAPAGVLVVTEEPVKQTTV